MSKKQETELVPSNATTALAAPALPGELAERYKPGDGLERGNETGGINRLAIVQSASSPELKADYGEGAIILKSLGVTELIAAPGDSVTVIPVCKFVSWAKWADANEGTNQPVIDETMDPDSEIARKAKSRHDRTETYENDAKLKYQYVEHLNWLVVLPFGTLALVTFKESSWKTGIALSNTLRRTGGTIFQHRVKLFNELDRNKQGQAFRVWRAVLDDPAFVTDPEHLTHLAALREEAQRFAVV